MKTTLIVFSVLYSFSSVFGQVDDSNLSDTQKLDLKQRQEFARECQYNKEFLKREYNIQCELNYHHYNSSSYREVYNKRKALHKKTIKISEFNALHPGMSKTLFKDYKKIAQMMNRFDLIGVTELIPLVSDDFKNNQAVVNFVAETPSKIRKIKKEISTNKKLQAARFSSVRKRRILLLEKQLKQLKKDLAKAKDLYREPGYVRILNELRKLKKGKDWALIISPRGEAAPTSSTVELVGYYYRSSIIKPKNNDHCKGVRKFGNATPFACIVDMTEKDLGDEDKSHVFSRRPFMAEFISGNFPFVVLTSHVIFDSPQDESLMTRIMDSAFGVTSYEDLGVGINKANYARFAEVKVTLDFIKRYTQKNKRKDVIFMGDLNLEMDNKFWPKVMKAWPKAKLFIDEKTSTNQARFHADGSPTNGVSSNYDHFIFDPIKTKECVNKSKEIIGGAFNFQKGHFKSYIDRIYKVRYENKERGQYLQNTRQYEKVYDKFIVPFDSATSKRVLTIGNVTHTLKNPKHRIISRGIIPSIKEMDFYAEKFQERVMDSQFSDDTYYYFYEQLISDHLAIHMSCSNQ